MEEKKKMDSCLRRNDKNQMVRYIAPYLTDKISHAKAQRRKEEKKSTSLKYRKVAPNEIKDGGR